MKLTIQQEEEIKNIIRRMKSDDEEDGLTTNLKFANKYSTEEMMNRIAISYN